MPRAGLDHCDSLLRQHFYSPRDFLTLKVTRAKPKLAFFVGATSVYVVVLAEEEGMGSSTFDE